jgi:hypothetical protein
LDGSVPDLPGQLAGLFAGKVNVVQFKRRVGVNSLAIEVCGSDERLELLNLVAGLLDEYIGDSIETAELLDALQIDPLVQKELAAHRIAVASSIFGQEGCCASPVP